MSHALFTKKSRIMQDGKVELLFNDDVDGIVTFLHNKAVFEWQCKRTSLGGYIHFHNGNEAEIGDTDNDWIRAVCQSLKILH